MRAGPGGANTRTVWYTNPDNRMKKPETGYLHRRNDHFMAPRHDMEVMKIKLKIKINAKRKKENRKQIVETMNVNNRKLETIFEQKD